MTAMPQTLLNVQALRGVACLMVVLFHLQHWDAQFGRHTYVVQESVWFGFAGVDLFFVLSGFIIAHTNRKNLGRPAAAPGYLLRRLWRIYSAYWAAMLVGVVTTVWLTGVPPQWKVSAGTWAAWATLAPTDAAHLNMVFGQAWTLTYEVGFYVAFGVLMVLPPRLAAVGLAGWGAAVVAAVASGPGENLILWSPVSPLVLEFLAGCLIAYLTGCGVTGGRWAAVAVALVWAVAAGYAVSAVGGERYLDQMGRAGPRVLVWGVPAALVVYAAVAAELRSSRRPPRWLLAVGDASYSIYLLHFHVLLAAVYFGTKMPHGRWPHFGWVAATVLGCVGAGLAFHRAVERPLLSLAKRRRPKPHAPEMTAALRAADGPVARAA